MSHQPLDPVELPLEAPEAHVVEQRAIADPAQADDELGPVPPAEPVLEADTADVAEQAIPVPLSDDEAALG